ncbi:RNA polymerase sigma factor [Belliella marina]|uniref:RNA polymerase sigma factor n=1 Tax=Belliella marina TaxID=1644146 RepID=A0ABW4VR10_9BACT
MIGVVISKVNEKYNEGSSLDQKSYRWDKIDDSLLWERFKCGDESAFVYIYEMYFQELCGFGSQFAPLDVVEDCIQDMFIDVRKKRAKQPQLRNSIRSFLFQALKRRIFNWLKANKGKRLEYAAAGNFDVVPSHESLIIMDQRQKEILERLDIALEGLKDKQREVVYYYFYKGMSYEEIQQLMGFGQVKSARNIVYKVINKLKDIF